MTKGQVNKIRKFRGQLEDMYSAMEAIHAIIEEKHDLSSDRAQSTEKGERRYAAIQDIGVALECIEQAIDCLQETIDSYDAYHG